MRYIDFIQLNEFDRLTLIEAVKCSVLPEVDCTLWTWGQVKESQEIMKEDATFEDVLKLVRYQTKLNQYSEARLILQFYLAIQKSISEITKVESEATAYQATPKEIAAAEEVGGFEVFGTLPQTLRLVGIIAPDIKGVEATDYNTAFAALVYQSRLNDFQKIVTK